MPNPKITGNVIGHKIQKARKSAGLTQLDISTILGVDYKIELSPELISRIESGRRPVRDKELIALCKIINIDPNTLFDWK